MDEKRTLKLSEGSFPISMLSLRSGAAARIRSISFSSSNRDTFSLPGATYPRLLSGVSQASFNFSSCGKSKNFLLHLNTFETVCGGIEVLERYMKPDEVNPSRISVAVLCFEASLPVRNELKSMIGILKPVECWSATVASRRQWHTRGETRREC